MFVGNNNNNFNNNFNNNTTTISTLNTNNNSVVYLLRKLMSIFVKVLNAGPSSKSFFERYEPFIE